MAQSATERGARLADNLANSAESVYARVR